MTQDYLKICPVKPEYQDEDWEYIVFEFAMNFDLNSFRKFYYDEKKKENGKVDADKLRKLGYSEEAIKKRRL